MEKNKQSLFDGAKTNSAFLFELTKMLLEMGKKMAISIIKKYGIYNVVVEDIEDYILYVINSIYETYDYKHENFDEYAKYVLYRRIESKIIDLSHTFDMRIQSLDQILSDGTPLIELISDDEAATIPEEISSKEFRLRMSSPKATDSRIVRKKRKVYNLYTAGYTSKEIMQILDLTEGQYRYIIKLLIKEIKDFKIRIEEK